MSQEIGTAQVMLAIYKHIHTSVGLVGMVESQTDPFFIRYWHWSFLGLCKTVQVTDLDMLILRLL